MGRAGAAVRQRARRGRVEWIRGEAKLLVGVLCAYACASLTIFSMQAPGVRPFFAGGLVVGGVWLLFWLLSLDGFDRVRLGAEAEYWTSSTLRKARRRGWKVVDSVPFEGFDVDHVFVGPGGVFAVETKFTSAAWHQVGGELIAQFGDPLGQAAYGARKIRLLLASRGCPLEVTPVLLAWGKGAERLPGGDIAGVLVIPGRELKSWVIERQASGRLAAPQVREVTGLLKGFIREREEYEDGRALPSR